MSVESAQEAYDNACQYEEEAEKRYSEAKEAYDVALERKEKAENAFSEAKDLFIDFQIWVDNYRADYSLFHSPGEDALMRYVASDDVRDAILSLKKILDTVEAYCNCPMTLESVRSNDSYSHQDNHAQLSKEEKKYRREQAMENAFTHMQKERPRNMPNPDTLVRCKICGRPSQICRCRKGHEMPDVNQ